MDDDELDAQRDANFRAWLQKKELRDKGIEVHKSLYTIKLF